VTEIQAAAAAVASLPSVSLSSSAIAAPDNQVFERQESSLQDLEMHLGILKDKWSPTLQIRTVLLRFVLRI
jgi:hypothetical protein